ncbi:hypothetical protein [Dyadobacter sp. CY356]|uniref:hypothetical protein n=1 Tax=Dyadobacter sp. CY356 TaxID=2906442 RepID=UPI001F3C62E6|nr:hypothetical protein [Dyadobacter sp. CY356]MCF0057081.1 hypothetical protein [Dyadobacter sp. CY356]
MDEIRVVNIFQFTSQEKESNSAVRMRDNEIKETIRQMEKLASTYNFYQKPVTVHFFGDTKSNLRFRVECNDSETRIRIENALKLFQKNH